MLGLASETILCFNLISPIAICSVVIIPFVVIALSSRNGWRYKITFDLTWMTDQNIVLATCSVWRTKNNVGYFVEETTLLDLCVRDSKLQLLLVLGDIVLNTPSIIYTIYITVGYDDIKCMFLTKFQH